MGRMYTAVFRAIAVTAAQDLWEILAATGKPVIIHGFLVAQSTDVGDAAEEILVLSTNRGVGSVTSGSGGTTPITAQPVDDGSAAASVTIDRNNTTPMAAGSGSIEELETHAMNVRVPYMFWYPPEMRPLITPGNRWTLELKTVPADSLTMNSTVWFEEIG